MSAKKNLLTKREKEMKKIHIYFNRFPQIYGAQNEAYKCPLFENVVNDLCFS